MALTFCMHVLVLYFLLFNLKPYDLLIVKRTPTFDFCLSFEARLFLSNNDDKKTCFSSLAFASEFDTHKSRRPSRVVENFTLEKELSRFWHDSSLDTSKRSRLFLNFRSAPRPWGSSSCAVHWCQTRNRRINTNERGTEILHEPQGNLIQLINTPEDNCI